MEYAKDIIINLKEGHAGKSKKRERLNKKQNQDKKTRTFSISILKDKIKTKFGRIGKGILDHKIMTTIVTATVSFMILDILLISSFVQILVKI